MNVGYRLRNDDIAAAHIGCRFMRFKKLSIFITVFMPLVFCHADTTTEDVVAVVTTLSGPYLEAFESFEKTMGQPIPVINLTKPRKLRMLKQAKVIVAFGGRAASQKYPSGTTLIYALAPGTNIQPGDQYTSTLKIHMQPRPDLIAFHLKDIHPSMKSLVVFWRSDTLSNGLDLLKASLNKKKVDVLLEKLDDAKDLPERLRALKGKADALWIPPDPLLINAHTFTLLRIFSRDNNIPFFAPTPGLVENGAVASICSSFDDVAKATAKAVHEILSGAALDELYPENSEIVINMKAAAQCYIEIPEHVLKKAKKIIQ